MAIDIERLLRQFDEKALFGNHTWEPKPLEVVSAHFPELEGSSFKQWLASSRSVLEFGGADQVVAQEILATHEGITEYVGIDIRSLRAHLVAQLSEFPQHRFVQSGLANFEPTNIGESRFGVAFAHDVAPCLAHPLLLVQKLHDSLDYRGVLFVNNILLYAETEVSLEEAWKKKGYAFNISSSQPEGPYAKAGIRKVSMALMRTEDFLQIPQVGERHLVGINGVVLPTLEYERI